MPSNPEDWPTHTGLQSALTLESPAPEPDISPYTLQMEWRRKPHCLNYLAAADLPGSQWGAMRWRADGVDLGESRGGWEANTTQPLGFSGLGDRGSQSLDRLTRYTLGGFSLLSATSHLHDPSPTLLSLKRER